jgi:hypothetical protein
MARRWNKSGNYVKNKFIYLHIYILVYISEKNAPTDFWTPWWKEWSMTGLTVWRTKLCRLRPTSCTRTFLWIWCFGSRLTQRIFHAVTWCIKWTCQGAIRRNYTYVSIFEIFHYFTNPQLKVFLTLPSHPSSLAVFPDGTITFTETRKFPAM